MGSYNSKLGRNFVAILLGLFLNNVNKNKTVKGKLL